MSGHAQGIRLTSGDHGSEVIIGSTRIIHSSCIWHVQELLPAVQALAGAEGSGARPDTQATAHWLCCCCWASARGLWLQVPSLWASECEEGSPITSCSQSAPCLRPAWGQSSLEVLHDKEVACPQEPSPGR